MKEIIVVGYQEYDFAQSLVVGEISYLDLCCDLSSFDALLITSKTTINALIYNANQYSQMQEWKKIPAYVIGEGSAKALLKNNGTLFYTAKSSIGKEFALELPPLLKGKNVFFPHAKKIISKLDEFLLSYKIQVFSSSIYEVYPKQLPSNLAPKDNAILLFTSPSAFAFFSQNFHWKESYRAIAIGKTTFDSLPFELQSNPKTRISPFQNVAKTINYFKNIEL